MAVTREQLDQLYQQELGRPLGSVGEQYWLGQSGLTNLEDIRGAVQQSEEYKNFQSQQQQQQRPDQPGGFPPEQTPPPPATVTGINQGQIPGVTLPTDPVQLPLDQGTGAEGGRIDEGPFRTQPLVIPAPEQKQPAIQVPEGYSVPQLTNVLNDVYSQVLGRPLGKEGQRYWINEFNRQVAEGTPVEQANQNIYNAIANSAEAEAFRSTGVSTGIPEGDQRIEGLDYEPQAGGAIPVPEGTSESQLTTVLNDVYTTVLGRPVGKEGQQYWIRQYNELINSGVSPEQANQQIYDAIYNSEEAKNFRQFGVSTGVPQGDQRVPGIDYGDAPTTETEIYERMTMPTLPDEGKVEAEKITREPGQFLDVDSGIGQVSEMRQAAVTTQAGTSVVDAPEQAPTSTMSATETSDDIANALRDVNPAAGSVSENAQMQAITQSPTSTDVGTVGPAQLANATQVDAPQSRTLQSGETVQSAVDLEKAMAFVDQAQAATADPSAKATVQGQLADIMSQFDGGQIPAWAAGAMRTANATLAARGLGASSLAGQAVVQAAMEASLPIAVQDATTQAQFEQQNLSNRQQRAMLAAQQRASFMQQEFDQEFQARVANAAKISDIANMNFSAEQQIALENARLAQTVNLANLSNRQAMVMAETSQIAQLELSNLNNRQQAAVQNANAFLQMDMANLSNEQQITMFDAQSRVNAIFSDAAAENAARQFNAESENQANQFFQSLSAQVQQFNANQLNSMEQFRVEQANTMERFNAQLASQQEQFNADNQLVVAQSDAQWNRQIATADTAATNMANQLNAQSIMEMSNQAFANAAQILRDQMEFSFQAGQDQADRDAEIVLQLLANEGASKVAEMNNEDDGLFGNIVGKVIGKVIGF